MTNLDDKLIKRGIHQAALDNGWRERQRPIHDEHDVVIGIADGWDAPIFDCTGKPIVNRKKGKPLLTWKNADSSADPHDAWCNYIEGFKPLMLPKHGIIASVKHAEGRLNLCEGKADTLSMFAAKIGNTIGVFGRSMVPDDFLAQLQLWQVTSVKMFVHPDDAGQQCAQKVADVIHGEIDVRFYALPTLKDGSKIDVNDFWIHSKFDTQIFRSALAKLPEKHLEARPLPVWKPAPTQPTDIPLPRIQAYANAALTRILGDLLCVTDGRNIALNNAAFKAGTFVGAGALDQFNAEHELVMAGISIGLGQNATKATVKSGLTAGEKNPADLSRIGERETRVPRATVRIIDAIDGKATADTAEPDQMERITNVRTGKSYTDQRRKEKTTCQAADTLPMPFQTVVQKGGFASSFKRGKIAAFIGDSGAGKTSMLQSLIGAFLPLGYGGVIYSPEWTGDEWVMSEIQALGGPSYMAQVAHDSKPAIANEQEREYQAVTDRLLDTIDSWPGKLYFVEQAIDPCAEDVIAGMNAAVLDAEAKGKPLAFAVVDYAQMFLSRTGKTELEQMNRALYQFKKFCIAHDLVGLVGSQITKEAGRQAKGRPSHTGMMGARSDAFNFAAFIVRERAADDSYNPDAMLHVVKNSRGKLGKCEIYQDPVRMSWHSGRWQPQRTARPAYSEPKPPIDIAPIVNDKRVELLRIYGERYSVGVGKAIAPNTLAMMRVWAKADGKEAEFNAVLTADERNCIDLLDTDDHADVPELIVLKP